MPTHPLDQPPSARGASSGEGGRSPDVSASGRPEPDDRRRSSVGGSAASHAQAKRVGWVALALAIGCVLIAADFWGTVVFASWTVTTFYGVYQRLSSKLRPLLSALALTLAIVVVIMAPLVIIGIIVTSRSIELVTQAVRDLSVPLTQS